MHGQLWRDESLTDLYAKPYIYSMMKPSGEQLGVTCGD